MCRVQVLLIFCNLGAAATLRVNISHALIFSLVKNNIFLPCHFLRVGDIRLEDVAVKWTASTKAGKKQVYTFNGSHSECHRLGAAVDLHLLTSGEASLSLQDVTLDDEGSYTCTVLISPEFDSGTVQLRVAAQPSVEISPVDPHLTEGEEKTFFCAVQFFYPVEIHIVWLVESGGNQELLTKGVCTGVAALNDNGTFSTLSRITLVMSKNDEGSMYICQVRHESLEHTLRRNTTLFLAAPQRYHTDTGFVVTVVIISVLVTSVSSIFFTIFYQKRIAKVGPLVSSILVPALITINEKMVFICNINGFRPKVITVRWHIRKKLMYLNDENKEDSFFLQPQEDITKLAEQPLEKHSGFFSVTSRLTYTPTVRDDEATIICSVEHKALKSPVEKKASIKVTARPSSYYITSWPQVPKLGEKLTLSCIVERFYPKDIALAWFKNGQPVGKATQFGPFACESDYYSVWSETEFTLTKDDEGVIFTCQIDHSSFGKVEELSYEINVKGTPPEVLFITGDPLQPVVGEELRLSCKISNFSSNVIEVNWFRNGHPLSEGVNNSLSVVCANGLHSMWTVLKLVPTAEDQGSLFMCRVDHIAFKDAEERSYTLRLST